jgi:hypothetical protein
MSSPFVFFPLAAHWENLLWESWRLSLSLTEVLSTRSLMIGAAMAGETRYAEELQGMVSEKFAVLPEISVAMMREGLRLAGSGRTHLSEADMLAWQKAVSAPVHKRVHANAKRLRKRK